MFKIAPGDFVSHSAIKSVARYQGPGTRFDLLKPPPDCHDLIFEHMTMLIVKSVINGPSANAENLFQNYKIKYHRHTARSAEY